MTILEGDFKMLNVKKSLEGRIVLCQQLLRFGDLREDDNLIHSYVWLVVSNKNLSYEDEKRHTYIFETIINGLIT